MTQPTTRSAPSELSRLVYLIAKHQIPIPKMLIHHIPFGVELSRMSEGIGHAGPVDELAELYQQGAILGEGSRTEAVTILTRFLEASTALDASQRLLFYPLLATLAQGGVEAADTYQDIDLNSDPDNIPEIPKWSSGFMPLDIVTGGLYQSLLVMMGAPGTGKTSMMLTMMEALIEQNACEEVWFFQNEIPFRMMEGRLSHIRQRITFRPGDRVTCGPYSSDKIVAEVLANPNPNRIIFFDSPDVQFSSPTGERRFDLERSYQQLILIKPKTKMIIIPSQPRRNDTNLSLQSPAESWAKAWYADIMIGLQRAGTDQVLMKVVKNRFGPNLGSLHFHYDYSDLSYTLPEGIGSEWGEW